jgi:hypothetical protein
VKLPYKPLLPLRDTIVVCNIRHFPARLLPLEHRPTVSNIPFRPISMLLLFILFIGISTTTRKWPWLEQQSLLQKKSSM